MGQSLLLDMPQPHYDDCYDRRYVSNLYLSSILGLFSPLADRRFAVRTDDRVGAVRPPTVLPNLSDAADANPIQKNRSFTSGQKRFIQLYLMRELCQSVPDGYL